jgi:hypothetical protein
MLHVFSDLRLQRPASTLITVRNKAGMPIVMFHGAPSYSERSAPQAEAEALSTPLESLSDPLHQLSCIVFLLLSGCLLDLMS